MWTNEVNVHVQQLNLKKNVQQKNAYFTRKFK